MALPPAVKKRLPLIVGGVVAIGLIIGGVVWWQGKQRWESTDNAFVDIEVCYGAELELSTSSNVKPHV